MRPPATNGDEGTLLAAHPNLRALYASGNLEDSLEEYVRERGQRVFLHKPFTVDALVRKVPAALET